MTRSARGNMICKYTGPVQDTVHYILPFQTMGHVKDICNFLGAEHLTGTFRTRGEMNTCP